MKKLSIIIMSICLIIGMTACGSENSKEDSVADFYQDSPITISTADISYEVPAEWKEKNEDKIYENYYLTSVGDSYLQLGVSIKNMTYINPSKHAEIVEGVYNKNHYKNVTVDIIDIAGVKAYAVSGIDTNDQGELTANKDIFFVGNDESEGYHFMFYKSNAETFTDEEYENIIKSIRFN